MSTLHETGLDIVPQPFNSTLAKKPLFTKISNYSIQLCGERTVFLPGQPIEGVVSFAVHGSCVHVDSLTVHVHGFAHTALYRMLVHKLDETNMYGSTSTQLFKESLTVLSGINRNSVPLAPGVYTFPFRMQLPSINNLPATFQVCYPSFKFPSCIIS
jgi:hypothetical protein